MGPLRFNFGSVLGLCWAIWRLQKTRVNVYYFTRVFFGRILEPSWAYIVSSFGPFWGYVGLCWRLSGLKFQPQPKHGSVEVEFWVGFWAYVGPFGGYVGPLLVLGLCWAIWRLQKTRVNVYYFTRVFFGRILEPSWAYILSSFGPFWGYVGLCWRLSGLKFQPQPKHDSVEVEFWVGFGLMLGHLEAMLGLCWAILGLCWALLAAFGPKISTPTEAWLR